MKNLWEEGEDVREEENEKQAVGREREMREIHRLEPHALYVYQISSELITWATVVATGVSVPGAGA